MAKFMRWAVTSGLPDDYDFSFMTDRTFERLVKKCSQYYGLSEDEVRKTLSQHAVDISDEQLEFLKKLFPKTSTYYDLRLQKVMYRSAMFLPATSSVDAGPFGDFFSLV